MLPSRNPATQFDLSRLLVDTTERPCRAARKDLIVPLFFSFFFCVWMKNYNSIENVKVSTIFWQLFHVFEKPSVEWTGPLGVFSRRVSDYWLPAFESNSKYIINIEIVDKVPYVLCHGAERVWGGSLLLNLANPITCLERWNRPPRTYPFELTHRLYF